MDSSISLLACVLYGWAGGIRTPECQDQNLVPYRLATAQQPTHTTIYGTLNLAHERLLEVFDRSVPTLVQDVALCAFI